ncbi:tyrosine kinase receptor Cad96Ca-like, partial [Saccoglossus kowalevskii]
PPTVTILNRTDVILIEGDAHISVCVVDSNPVVEGKWVQPDGSLSLGPTLEINNITRTDSGTYTCFAETVFWDGSTASDSDSMHIEYSVNEVTDDYKYLLLKELDLLKSISSHAHIVTLIGCCTQTLYYGIVTESLLRFVFLSGPICVVLEYMALGNLQTFLREEKSNMGNNYANLGKRVTTLSQHNRVVFSHQISMAMEFIEGKGCVHRDLAARNVLLNEKLVCKLSGFELATTVLDQREFEKRTQGRLPVRWMVPESILYGIYSTKSDVWSYGVVLLEIATLGDVPYTDMSTQEVIEFVLEGYRMKRPDKCRLDIYSKMEDCWVENPERRPSFQQLTEYFQAMDDDRVSVIPHVYEQLRI